MTGKKVSIGSRPSKKDNSQAADTWVKDRNAEVVSSEKMKRLTIDIPESLHRAIKIQCAARGEKMANEIREHLARIYGEK